jgi:hypothetical protein
MDTQSLPAVGDVELVEPLVDSHCGGPSRSLWMAPVAAATGGAAVPPELVDMIAASLRAVCQDERDSDRAFWLIARIVDQHLADTLSPGTGRWKGEAIDALMGMLSRPLLVELHRHLAEQGRLAERGAVASGSTPPHH